MILLIINSIEQPCSAQALAGFMVVKNHSDQAIALIQAKAKDFNHAMLHQSINEKSMH